ncbi:MAG TPA: hypothetical protein VFD35_07545 [Pricia sp.]|nr:hypothetical protein [Pricia sp.]
MANAGSEAKLKDRPASEESFTQLAQLLVKDAKGYGHNDFKIQLAKNTIVRALLEAKEK